MSLFNFFKKEKSVDVNKPIVNPSLKKAFSAFAKNKSEATLQTIITEMKKASFLVLIDVSQIPNSSNQPFEVKKTVSFTANANKPFFEVGSTFSFLKTYNENNDCFLPVFTDWKEIDLWISSRENIAGWIMSIKDIFDFVLESKQDKGVVINPSSDTWAINHEQINTFLKEEFS